MSSISAYLRFDFPRLPPFARLRPFEIDFSRCKYRSPGCGLGMFSRLSEADGVLINLKLFFSCPPVASRRRFERSVARLCSMVVIFRFARATTPGCMRVLVSRCAALSRVRARAIIRTFVKAAPSFGLVLARSECGASHFANRQSRVVATATPQSRD